MRRHDPLVVALTYAATLNTNAQLGDIFRVTLTGNTTLANPTNAVDSRTLQWFIKQDGTGGRMVSLGSKFRILSCAASLSFSSAANRVDFLEATYNLADDKWDIVRFLSGSAWFPGWQIKTANCTVVAGDAIQTDGTGGAFTITLPSSATIGDSILIEDGTLDWATHNITLNRNGLKINGGTSNYTANVTGGKLSLAYISAAYGWSIK